MAANVVLSFNQITFELACYSSLSGTRIHYRKLCSGKVIVVSTPVQHSRWTRIRKLYHVNDHQSANRVGIAVFSSGQLSLKRRRTYRVLESGCGTFETCRRTLKRS